MTITIDARNEMAARALGTEDLAPRPVPELSATRYTAPDGRAVIVGESGGMLLDNSAMTFCSHLHEYAEGVRSSPELCLA